MTTEIQILTAIRQTYKKDPCGEKNEQLYNKILKALFRYDTDNYTSQFASRAALEKANDMDIDLKTLTWHTQPKFDKHRSIFHYEHCNPISQLCHDVLKTERDLADILNDNITCWILKNEDANLNNRGFRSERGNNWQDCYQKCGIEPIEINKKEVSKLNK